MFQSLFYCNCSYFSDLHDPYKHEHETTELYFIISFFYWFSCLFPNQSSKLGLAFFTEQHQV